MHLPQAIASKSCSRGVLRRACLAAAALAWPALSHAAAAPAASLQPSKALGVVGQEVELAISLSGASPEALTGARVVIEHVRPDGEVAVLGGGAGATVDGLTVRQAFVPAVSGFHRFRARVMREGAEELVVEAGELPVMVEDLSIFYWNGPRTLENLNWRLCLSEEEAQYWSARGVTAARWAPGLAKKEQGWGVEEYVERWAAPLRSGFGGIAIDEFNGHTDSENALAMSEALRRVKAERPDMPLAVWVIRLVAERAQAAAFKDAADVLMLEVYSSHDEALGRFTEQWAIAESEGLADKAIFALWLDRVLTTREGIERQLQHIRRIAPNSRGICFNGKAAEHLFDAADELTRQYFIEPVLRVERGKGGLWQCRNIGWMAARDVEVRAAEGAARTRRIAAIEPGEVVDLRLSGADRPELVDSDRYTWLMAEADEPAAPEPSAAEAAFASANEVDLLRDTAATAADGAILRIPVDPELTQGPFGLTFDIAFEAVGAYGVAAVGLGSREIQDYSDKFLEYFSGVRSPNRLEVRFYRGDLEVSAKSAYRVRGARGRFGYEGANGDFVRAASMMPFEAGKSYRVWIGCEEWWAEVKITNLTDPSEVWRSGRLRIDSPGRFDELYLRVREGAASEITLHADRGEAVLRSGTSPKETDRVVTTATVSNVRVAPLR